MEDEQACSRCQTTKTLRPDVKLLVGPCLHRLCENCLAIYTYQKTPCPSVGCGTLLLKSDFFEQKFEDLKVQKEIRIRKQISNQFCKREGNFKSLREYNDYLEEIEDIVFNLLNDIDLEKTKEKIELLKQENRRITAQNRIKQETEDKIIKDLVEKENAEKLKRIAEDKEERRAEMIRRKKEEKELLDAAARGVKAPVEKKLLEKKKVEKQPIVFEEKNQDTTAFRSMYDMIPESEDRNDWVEPMELDEGDQNELNPTEFQKQWTYPKERLVGYFDPIFNQLKPEDVQRKKAGGYSMDLYFAKALESSFLTLDWKPKPLD